MALLAAGGPGVTSPPGSGRAIAAYRQAADIFHQVGDQEGKAMALNNLGNALRRVGRIEDAIGALTQAVEISRQGDDQHSKAKVLGSFGRALEAAGRSDEAIAACTQAADIFRQLGDRRCEAAARDNLRRMRRFSGAQNVWRSITGPLRRAHGPG
ncbi:tetratricopeptide repeat protein [Streptomyces sp. NPDC001514]